MISKNFNKNIIKEKIGLAGCGNMGLPMLNAMLSKNIDAKGYDIEKKKSTKSKSRKMQSSAKIDVVNLNSEKNKIKTKKTGWWNN